MSRDVQPSSLGLRNMELLEGLAPERLDAIARQCVWRNYEAGNRIISRNAADRDVYLLVSGRVRITTYSQAGRQVTFDRIGCRPHSLRIRSAHKAQESKRANLMQCGQR